MLAYAEGTKEHIIERGETLESIAKKYGVTTDAIIKLNPVVKDMFYSGMIINIPEKINSGTALPSSTTSAETQASDITHNQAVESQSYVMQEVTSQTADYTPSYMEEMSDKGSSDLRFLIGYDINTIKNSHVNNKDMYSNGFSMSAEFLYRYYFINRLYGEGGVGITCTSTSAMMKSPSYKKYTTDNYAIPLDINVGYTIPFGDKFGIDIFTGPEFQFTVSNTFKEDGNKTRYKGDGKSGVAWDFGINLSLASFNIGAEYRLPLTNNYSVEALGNDLKKHGFLIYIGYTLPI